MGSVWMGQVVRERWDVPPCQGKKAAQLVLPDAPSGLHEPSRSSGSGASASHVIT